MKTKHVNILNYSTSFTVQNLTRYMCTGSEVRVQNLKTGSELFKGSVLNVPEWVLNKEVYSFYSEIYVTVINV